MDFQGRGFGNYLAPPYYSQRAVFASPLSTFFIVNVADWAVCCRATDAKLAYDACESTGSSDTTQHV